MKHSILITLSIFLATILTGQELKVSIGPTNNNAFYYQPVNGAARYNSKPGISASLGYIHKSEKRIALSYGLIFKFAQFEVDPWIDPTYNPPSYIASVKLLSLNIEPVLNFKRHFYLSMGPTLDLQIKDDSYESLDNQTGLGLTIGFGKKFRLKSNIFLHVEPRIWIHNIVPMQDEGIPLRLTTTGLNLGFGIAKKRS